MLYHVREGSGECRMGFCEVGLEVVIDERSLTGVCHVLLPPT